MTEPIRTSFSPADARAPLLTAVARALRADAAVLHRVVRARGSERVCLMDGVAAGSRGLSEAMAQVEGIDIASFCDDVATALPTGTFAGLVRTEAAAPLWSGLWDALALQHVVGAVLTDGDTVVGVAWLARVSEPFTEAELRAAERWLGPLTESISEDARHLEAQSCSVLIDGAGRAVLSTCGVEMDARLLQALRSPVRALLAGWGPDRVAVGGAFVTMVRLQGSGTPTVLAHVECSLPVAASPLLSLSVVKRRIVSYAVQGATVPEIARAIGRSPETVRTHLKRVYQQIGVSSRVELAEVSRTMWA